MAINTPEPRTSTETSSFTLGTSGILEENFESRSNDFQPQAETDLLAALLAGESMSDLSLNATELHDVRSKAEKMDSEGCLGQFVAEYVSERKCFIKLRFQNLWDQNLQMGTAYTQKLEWEVLEVKIMRWIRGARCSLRDILACEKRLSMYVFQGLGNASTARSCFIEIVKDPVARLLDFPEALCSCRRSPERLRKMLLLHTSFSHLISDVKASFGASEEEIRSIQARADVILSRLGEVVRLTLVDFEAAILGDLDECPAPDGAIHRLTKYVMDYIIGLTDFQESLMELILSKPSVSSGDGLSSKLEVAELERQTPLAAHLLWTIIVLLNNLERKSKSYRDPSLSNLFVMNNIHYIVQGIRKSRVLRQMAGCYLNKLTEIVREAMYGYLKASWDQVMYCLRSQGLRVVSWGCISWVSKNVPKDRLKKFNKLFAEIHFAQTMWTVPDLGLREGLQRSIRNRLIPTYESYLRNFGSHIMSGEGSSERCILYSVEELEDRVLELFTCPLLPLE
ncbi:exocyst complex component EXO70A1-like [Coffea eugenioides]|uniref:exocyst complex component EXO70A1-like n=1 Tax=Coffea eugenioides TaxID=49369 RepID=UPI000F60693F|nr:exocyst complex component EXO70A1-like [Coffea eugenioides]